MADDYLERLRARRVDLPEEVTPAPPVRAPRTLTETQRVLSLPVEDYGDLRPGTMTSQLARPGGEYTLRPIQEAALHAIRQCRGGFFPIGVGHGKSFIACLAATVLDCNFAIILAPASTVRQLQEQYDELRSHFRLVPARIMSYATLSQPTGTSLLTELVNQYSADKVALICDEAHRLKRLESARTKRVLRFMQANEAVSFVALSGTMTSKSLRDFSHLAELCLRENSPVPRDRYHLQCWSECIDVAGRPGQNEWRMVRPLAQWANMPLGRLRGEGRKEQARKAFQKRLRSSPGVVASRKGSLGCSLNIQRVQSLPVPEELVRLMRAVADGGEAPGGDLIPDDVTAWRTMRHLSAGFYYKWVWPNDEEDLEWLRARRDWNRFVRHELVDRSDEGYDSPFLVAARINREAEGGSRAAIHRAWRNWQREKEKPTPPTVPVWVDTYLIDQALKWRNRQKRPVILWYESSAIGAELERRGVEVYGAGANPPRDAHDCAMSIKAHGIGKNLQSWSNQLVIEPPTGGLIWEQLLGRTHRQGQDADEVKCVIFQHVEPYTRALASAMTEAQYILAASGNAQKLLFANID
jgi:hypothetical protein